MRSIALDVHRDFCEVAIKEGAELRSAGRIETSAERLELFAQSLARDDQVALEATGPANAIARILEPHVGRVVIANTRRVRAIAEAKVKTDKLDARTLCELLEAGFLPAVWSPDEHTSALRGLLGRRERLVRSRTRTKNAVHAALGRNLKGRPPMSDVFGRAGRAWLGRLELPAHEDRVVESCLREIDFLSQEIATLESELARLALDSEQDNAFGPPSLTRHKLRRLELMAGAPPRRGQRSGTPASKREQHHERELSEQFEQAYRRLVADWQPKPKKNGAGATPGRASSKAA